MNESWNRTGKQMVDTLALIPCLCKLWNFLSNSLATEPASPQEREMPEPDEALSPNSNQQWTARCLDLEKLPVKTSVKHETSLRGIARDYNLKLGGDVNKDDIINSILESEGLPRKK